MNENSTNKLTVIRDIESPPGGWRLTVEQTGLTIRAPFFTILKRRVLAHLRANSIEIPEDFDIWCADAACRETSPGQPFCGGCSKKPFAGMPALSLAMAARFLNTMWQAVKDRKFVDKEERDRRLAICMECPAATNIGGCKSCNAIFRKVARELKDDDADIPEKKSMCSSCGCLIKAKTLLLNSTMDKAEGWNEGVRPDYALGCWRNE